MRRGFGLGRKRRQSLTHQAFAAIRRAGGTVLAAGAATPVLGPELVTNGDFSNGTVGWSGGTYPATLAVASGELVVTRASINGRASAAFQTTPGKQYLVSGWVRKIAGTTSADLGFANNDYGGSISLIGSTSASSLTYVTGIVTAVMTTSSVAVGGNGGVAGDQFGADNISVKEILGYTYGNPPLRNYFDSAGTDILDSVTQVDNPVGLVLDAAGTVGPNLVTTPSVTGSAIDGSTAVTPYTVGDGMVAGKTYQGTYTVTGYTGSNDVGFASGSFSAVTGATRVTANGTYTFIATAINPQISLFTRPISNTANFSNVTVREITVNHATQPTTGSKPTLRRGLVNQLLWSGDFSNAAWMKTNASVAGSLITTTTASNPNVQQVLTPNSPYTGVPFTFVVECSAGNTSTAVLQGFVNGGSGGSWSISSTFIVSGPGSINGAGEISGLTTDRTVVAMTGVSSATAGSLAFYYKNRLTGSQVGDTTNLHRAALYQGTVTAQQIIAAGGIPLTTTAPASSALGNYWWQFDPAAPGDFLQTSITTGNEGWICAGVTFGGALGNKETVFSSGAGAANLKGVWLTRLENVSNQLRMGIGNGTELTMPVHVGVELLNTKRVVEGGWDATTVFVGVDGATTSLARTGSASPSPSPLDIGRYVSGVHFLQGAMPVTVICPTLPPAADRALIRAWVAKQQGQTL